MSSFDQVAQTATSLVFTEGPAAAADGTVYFSDIENNRVLRLAPDGTRSIFREPSGRTNGNFFDLEGRLYHCEGSEFGPGGGRRITRSDISSGSLEVITERYHGVRYNSPNDVCVDGKGRVFFTDPCYGDRTQMEMSIEGVYRIDTDGSVHRILEQPAIERPNGIAVTQDARTMYVVDSCPVIGGNRKIWGFDLDESGNPSNQRVVYDFAPGRRRRRHATRHGRDPLCRRRHHGPTSAHETADVPPGIYVIRPDGQLLGCISIMEDVLTNLTFGGADGKTLYITAGKRVLTGRVSTPGQLAYPRWH